jgi:hypothetical protein
MQFPVAFGGNVTDAGTEATLGLSELRLNVMPFGAGVGMTRDTSLLAPGAMLTKLGTKTALERTWTVVLTEAYPDAVAVMMAEPKSTPKTFVNTVGAVWPA